MASASYLSPHDPDRPPLRRRATSLLLTVLAHLLIVWLLLRLAPAFQPPPGEAPSLSTFDVNSPTPAANRQTHKAEAKPRPKAAEPVKPPPPRPQIVPDTPPLVETPAPFKLWGGKEMFEAADIGKIPAQPRDGGGGADAGSGADSVAAYGPGEGPGGKRLYNAEWYREPTRAEMVTYLPPGGAPEGWAMIACQTIPDYRVENCRELGESPLGSKLARSLRQAAWQFKVRPPRINGKPVIGAWVRIRFDWTTGSVKQGG